MGGALGSALSELVSPQVMLLLIVGTLIGLVIGALPGIGAIVALSLMLPYTFHLSSFAAFALLLSLYAVVTTAGDLTSILLGIPSHPECAAMTLDGYALARKGQAGRAMSAAVYSALFGALFGCVVFLAVLPFMSFLVLHIAAPEIFLICMLGVLMVATVSGDSPIKGAIMGALGLLLATVGPDTQTGQIRFGFGSAYLLGGIPLVPLAVGLFAVPQLVQLHSKRRQSLGGLSELGASGRRAGFADTKQHWTTVIRGSITGLLTGIAPGLGSSMGQWAAYAQARQSAKDPKLFGRGDITGVIAPGAANNSKEAGALIPTLAFGVPGTGGMAILLSAFLILNLPPGPTMLHEHLNITIFMDFVLVAANVIGSLICLMLLRPLTRITKLRGSLLVPVIMFLVFIGAAANTGQIQDLVVMLGAGVIAWAVGRDKWPVVPVILGYVLGKTAEPNLFISRNAYGWSWTYEPLVLAIIALAVLAGILSIRFRRRQARSAAAATSAASRDAGSEPPSHAVEGEASNPPSTADSPTWSSLLIGAAIGAVAVYAAVEASGWPFDARLFPMAIAVVTIALTLGYIGSWIRQRVRLERLKQPHGGRAVLDTEPVLEDGNEGVGAEPIYGTGGGTLLGDPETRVDEPVSLAPAKAKSRARVAPRAMALSKVHPALGMFAWIALMFVLSYYVGIGPAGVALTLAYLAIAGREKIWLVGVLAVGVGLLYYYVFYQALAVPLPLPAIASLPEWFG